MRGDSKKKGAQFTTALFEGSSFSRDAFVFKARG
jgi:hypothetical protein